MKIPASHTDEQWHYRALNLASIIDDCTIESTDARNSSSPQVYSSCVREEIHCPKLHSHSENPVFNLQSGLQ
jgi:hypothetical protein